MRFGLKNTLLQSPSWICFTPCFAPAFAMAWMASATPAHAANECGAATGAPPSVVCADAGNPFYGGGILYETTVGLSLEVSSRVIVTRTEGHNHDAIRLVSHSAGPLTLMIHPGVVLSTGGETAHGIEVHANPTSTSDINIVSAADITYMSPAATGASGGIIGRISNAASTASMTITQKAESQ